MNARSQSAPSGPLVAGIDIGTRSLKAVLVDEDGVVVRRLHVPSSLSVGPGDRLEHDALATWWEEPRSALDMLFGGNGRDSREVVTGAGGRVGAEDAQGGRPLFSESGEDGPQLAERLRAVAVSAVMPSVAPVAESGQPLGPGLLYGSAGPAGEGDPTSSDEMERLAALSARSYAGAQGYWPAQAVANASLGGAGVLDLASAFATGPLFGAGGWDKEALARIGLDPASMPRVAVFGEAIGEVGGRGAVLGAGSVDGLCEQLVAGASAPGDVLITLGSTLVVWLCVPGWPETVPAGLWRVPHVALGMALVGGASNAGGLWVDWVGRLLRLGGSEAGTDGAGAAGAGGDDGAQPSPGAGRPCSAEPGSASLLRPDDVPLWWPWARGERVPWHDGSLRVGLAGAHISHGPAHLQRAALEASGFVVRLVLDRASGLGTTPGRCLVSGGGVSNHAWLQALAEVLGRPVVPMAFPDGAALGAAFLARMAAGLETSVSDASRWARWAPPVEPRADWAEAAGERYQRWLEGLPASGTSAG